MAQGLGNIDMAINLSPSNYQTAKMAAKLRAQEAARQRAFEAAEAKKRFERGLGELGLRTGLGLASEVASGYMPWKVDKREREAEMHGVDVAGKKLGQKATQFELDEAGLKSRADTEFGRLGAIGGAEPWKSPQYKRHISLTPEDQSKIMEAQPGGPFSEPSKVDEDAYLHSKPLTPAEARARTAYAKRHQDLTKGAVETARVLRQGSGRLPGSRKDKKLDLQAATEGASPYKAETYLAERPPAPVRTGPRRGRDKGKKPLILPVHRESARRVHDHLNLNHNGLYTDWALERDPKEKGRKWDNMIAVAKKANPDFKVPKSAAAQLQDEGGFINQAASRAQRAAVAYARLALKARSNEAKKKYQARANELRALGLNLRNEELNFQERQQILQQIQIATANLQKELDQDTVTEETVVRDAQGRVIGKRKATRTTKGGVDPKAAQDRAASNIAAAQAATAGGSSAVEYYKEMLNEWKRNNPGKRPTQAEKDAMRNAAKTRASIEGAGSR